MCVGQRIQDEVTEQAKRERTFGSSVLYSTVWTYPPTTPSCSQFSHSLFVLATFISRQNRTKSFGAADVMRDHTVSIPEQVWLDNSLIINSTVMSYLEKRSSHHFYLPPLSVFCCWIYSKLGAASKLEQSLVSFAYISTPEKYPQFYFLLLRIGSSTSKVFLVFSVTEKCHSQAEEPQV